MILVTGASGFVGRSLMRELALQGRPVKAFSGRINDSFAMRADLLDVDTVIHLASAESRDRIRLLEHVDIDGTEQLLRESHRAGVNHFIYLSRLNANPYSIFSLIRAKGQVEKLVQRSGLGFTVIRSASLFGRADRFTNVIAALAAWSWPFVWLPGGGRAAMQPLWVEDLVRCIASCLENDQVRNKIIELAGEERMRYREVVRTVLAAAGMRRWNLSPSTKIVRPISALIFGWWRRAPVTRFYMDRLSLAEVAPIDAVRRHFQFHPVLMRDHISYLRRSGHRWRVFHSG